MGSNFLARAQKSVDLHIHGARPFDHFVAALARHILLDCWPVAAIGAAVVVVGVSSHETLVLDRGVVARPAVEIAVITAANRFHRHESTSRRLERHSSTVRLRSLSHVNQVRTG